MCTRSSSNLPVESPPNPSTSNPKCRNRRRSKQPFILEESPVDTMADQRTMAELLRAPTEGYALAIVVPSILAEQFKLKHNLINMMTLDQFFGLEKDNPHDHIRWFNKITSTIKYKDVPNSAIKLMVFPFSLTGVARRWLEKEPPHSILTWEDLVLKFINEFFPPSGPTNHRNKISNFQQRFVESFHEAWDRYKDLLRPCPHHGFTELHQLDTFYNACLTVGGNTFPELKDNIQGYVAATAVNYNQGNFVYRSPGSLSSNTIANPKGELKAITTRSGIVLDGPSVPIPPPFVNPEEDERVDKTLTDQDLAEYTIKVPPPLVQKSKPPSQRNFFMHQRDPLYPKYPLSFKDAQAKAARKDEVKIHKFWHMFKQLHINITLADALILIPKYQKMVKALISNKEKL
nr:reverse transcriptase domain-containing protein [Tanacetum cinerariifolium]